MNEAIEDLKYFVAEFFDGSLQRCLELDELLWQVRLSHRHTPEMLHCEAEPSRKAYLDLADLGL